MRCLYASSMTATHTSIILDLLLPDSPESTIHVIALCMKFEFGHACAKRASHEKVCSHTSESIFAFESGSVFGSQFFQRHACAKRESVRSARARRPKKSVATIDRETNSRDHELWWVAFVALARARSRRECGQMKRVRAGRVRSCEKK